MYNKDLSYTLTGLGSQIRRFGLLGDSIAESSYMGGESDRFGFPAVVASAFGVKVINNGLSGRTLSSFLPYQIGSVGSASPNFNGEWLLDGSQWYWYRDTAWLSVPSMGSSTDRVGTNPEKLTELFDQAYVIIAHSAVNDAAANVYTGSNDFSANGSYHYKLLLSEIIKRLHQNNVTVLMVTGTTASDPAFHGKSQYYSQELIGRYSVAAREACFDKGVYCCDMAVRLNLELKLGRLDILSRIANAKPDDVTVSDWNAYLAANGDPSGTNIYRVFDNSEDDLHKNDADRSRFWYNLHPNVFGHYLIANELIKFIVEKGFTERGVLA